MLTDTEKGEALAADAAALSESVEASGGHPLPDHIFRRWRAVYAQLDTQVFGSQVFKERRLYPGRSRAFVGGYTERVMAINEAAKDLARKLRRGTTGGPSVDSVELYAQVETILQALRTAGTNEWATALDQALAGATSGEILGGVRVVLSWLRLSDAGGHLPPAIDLDTLLRSIDRAFRAVGQP
jgi:hypothetical protein